MPTFMRDPDTGKHHSGPDDTGIITHFPGTCTVRDVRGLSTNRNPFDPRPTAIETRLYPSHHGWVAICYERKGRITFWVQLNKSRAAWQRIEWPSEFDKHWDEPSVRRAIGNFLWAAECEEAGKLLPK